MTKGLSGLIAALGVFLWAALAAAPAQAATVTVATQDAAFAAVKAAKPGDVVQLSAPIATLTLSGLAVAAPGVTIQPAPGANPVLGRIVASNAQGLNFAGLDVAYTPSWMQGIYATGCARLTFARMHIHSADGSLTGGGFMLRECTDSAVTDSELDHAGVGGSFLNSDRMTVSGNRFHDIESDGLDVANTSHARVIGNRFYDFYPVAGDHPDGVQFYAVGVTTANLPTGSEVAFNDIRRGKGQPMPMQGIFVESQANLSIHDNAMLCTLYNGISVSGVRTASIVHNWVQGCDDTGTRIIARGGSDSITVTGNQVSQPPINLVQAGEAPVTNYIDGGGNVAIAAVKTPPAGTAPTSSAMDAWIVTTFPASGAAVPPPVTTPPVVTPPPAPDPRDAQIAALTAQVANLNTQVATLTAAANDNAAALAAAQGQAQTLTAQVAALQGQLTAAQGATSTLKSVLSSLAATATAASK